jgi:hypothetical protein
VDLEHEGLLFRTDVLKKLLVSRDPKVVELMSKLVKCVNSIAEDKSIDFKAFQLMRVNLMRDRTTEADPTITIAQFIKAAQTYLYRNADKTDWFELMVECLATDPE